jgi:hypothetical protein
VRVHVGKLGGNRRLDPRNFSEGLPQDSGVSRRICVFHMAASRNCERRAHAHLQKESRANSPRGNHGKEGGNSRPSSGVGRSRPLPEQSTKRLTLHRAIDELPAEPRRSLCFTTSKATSTARLPIGTVPLGNRVHHPGQHDWSIQAQKRKETICGFFHICLCWS